MSPFEIFSETPRPCPDLEALKKKFFKLGAQCHPDRFHEASEKRKMEAAERFSELNRAYQILCDPGERLQVLYRELMGNSVDRIQKVPEDCLELSFHVGGICREIDRFLQQPVPELKLLRVDFFCQIRSLTDRFEKTRLMLQNFELSAGNELRLLDQKWMDEEDKKVLAGRLEGVLILHVYLSRWKEQLYERGASLKTVLSV